LQFKSTKVTTRGKNKMHPAQNLEDMAVICGQYEGCSYSVTNWLLSNTMVISEYFKHTIGSSYNCILGVFGSQAEADITARKHKGIAVLDTEYEAEGGYRILFGSNLQNVIAYTSGFHEGVTSY
jgi:hypothetical protein